MGSIASYVIPSDKATSGGDPERDPEGLEIDAAGTARLRAQR
jgi:hypothetical protein